MRPVLAASSLLAFTLAACARGDSAARTDTIVTLDSATSTSVITLDTTPQLSLPATPAESIAAMATLRASTSATPATSDTVRGVIRRVGAEPTARLVLQPTSGASWAIGGALLAELSAAEGLVVTLEGRRTAERMMDAAPGGALVFDAAAYHVRAADGVAARDGVLVLEAGGAYLESPGTPRVRVGSLPKALTSQAGARVFLVGPLNAAPQAFGVLRAARQR